MVNDKYFPFGDHDGELIWNWFSRTICLLPVAIYWVKTFAIPVSKDTYATCFESGDHDGEIIGSVLLRSICSFEPSASARLLYVTEERSKDRSLFKLIVADADGSNEQILLRSTEPIISS